MPIKENIEKQYSKLLSLAKKHDDCFEKKGEGWSRRLELKEGMEEEYWETRSMLEEEVAAFMRRIKDAISMIPKEFKTYFIEQSYDPSGEIVTRKVYNDITFSYLNKSYERILQVIEGSYRGVLRALEEKKPIYDNLRDLRTTILTFTNSIDLFVPKIIMTIEKKVELVFKLRELGFEDISSEIETIESVESNVEKCTIVRNALEKVVKKFLEKKGKEAKGRFYVPLDNAIKEGLAERGQRNAIAGHYTFISKIIHGEIEPSAKNTQFAVDGAINILQSLLSREEVFSVFTTN